MNKEVKTSSGKQGNQEKTIFGMRPKVAKFMGILTIAVFVGLAFIIPEEPERVTEPIKQETVKKPKAESVTIPETVEVEKEAKPDLKEIWEKSVKEAEAACNDTVGDDWWKGLCGLSECSKLGKRLICITLRMSADMNEVHMRYNCFEDDRCNSERIYKIMAIDCRASDEAHAVDPYNRKECDPDTRVILQVAEACNYDTDCIQEKTSRLCYQGIYSEDFCKVWKYQRDNPIR